MPAEQATIYAAIIAAVVSLLSLIVTVVGWFFTAQSQKDLYDRQVRFEREKEIRQIVIPQRVKQLEDLRSWLIEGFRLAALDPNNERDVVEHRNWESQQARFIALAQSMDSSFPPSRQGNTRSLTDLIADYFEIMSTTMEKNTLGNLSAPDFFRVAAGAFPTAMERIEELIDQVASQSAE